MDPAMLNVSLWNDLFCLPACVFVWPAWLHGDSKKVLYPTDSYGQFCGQKGTSNV